MTSPFDYITVACFLGVVCAFLFLNDRSPKVLAHLMVPAIAFAVANQLGNAGSTNFAAILIAAGVAYAIIAIRK
jgi:hypothetical protein